MLQYGLNKKDKEQLELPGFLPSGFGRRNEDYIHIYVYQSDDLTTDENDVLVGDEIFPAGDIFPDDRKVDLDIGGHLREMGFTEGTYKVKYLFLKRLAGKQQTVFVNEFGEVHVGRVQTKVINGKTKYFSTKKFGKRQSRQELKEIFEKELKYVVKKISADKSEVEVDTQHIQNSLYRKRIKEINSWMTYTPLTNSTSGKIRFDLTDPNILILTPHDKEPGFSDAMIGGQITIKGMYSVTGQQILENIKPVEVPPIFTPEDVSNIDIFAGVTTGEEQPSVDEQIQERAADEEERGMEKYDRFSGVCFTGDTKVKLSNGRQVPIKHLRQGMKVKTEIGYAKILKLIKDERPYGDTLSKFKNLITTDNHPMKYRGKWYKAHEIGKLFESKPLNVYNLILDKHHTIVANNVVCATLGKWESMKKFEMWREKQITMLRTFDEEDDNLGRGSGGTTYSTPYIANNEVVVNDPPPSVTPENIRTTIAVSRAAPEVPTVPIPEPTIEIPIDYVGTIVEVLDNNRIRVDTSYEEGANKFEHSGEDNSRAIFDECFVKFKKGQIERLNTYMVCNGNYHLVLNYLKNPYGQETSRLVKLYEKLPDETEEMDLCYFVEEKMEPYEDTITLVPFNEEDPEILFLRLPDFNSTNNPINFRGTKFNNYTQLIGTDSGVQEDIQNKLVSQSLLDTQVNVDYSKRKDVFGKDISDYGFSNFAHFGSAEKRIDNFKKKLELIELYTSSSLSFGNVTGSERTIGAFNAKKRRVINSFDPYEHYLYFESSSYATSSVGEFYSASWPKENSTSPYTLVHTSGSAATDWYSTFGGYAKNYDERNGNRLVNNLPHHITTDTENNVFLDFMDMIGQQFDEIFVYLRHFTDMNERTNKLSEGISKDIVREVAKTMGFSVVQGNDLMILPNYLLGKDPDGTSKYESPQEQVTEEIWKRILANMPYFMKTKGTMRAMKGLLNCYGIPSSILRIREYGGPDKGTRVTHEVKRKFTYALDFKSSEYVDVEWTWDGDGISTGSGIRPETVEFRFRSPVSKDQVIMNQASNWAISLRDNGATDDYGYLEFAMSGSSLAYVTSSLLPVYNDEMWSVMLTRKLATGVDLDGDGTPQNIKYELTTKQYDSSREVILFQDSQSLTTNTAGINTKFVQDGNVSIGGSGTGFYTTQFSGSIMEYRLWSEPLSQSVFDNHVKAPKSYNGNTTESFFDNLIHRTQFNDNVTLHSTSSFTDNSFSGTYNATGSAKGFSGNQFRSLVDKEELRVPNLGPSRRNATKIRLEGTSLNGPLSSNIRREQSSQDFAPIDSNKLGVYFSPTDVVNEDIMYSIADFDFNDLVGDPRDVYEDSYRGLEHTQRKYWKKYSKTNSFWDYLRIIDFYDSGIWTQLRKLSPARANTTLGVLIEPNILERSKAVVGKIPEFDNQYFENADHFGYGINMTNFISGSDDRLIVITGEYPNYEGVVNVHNNESGSLGTLAIPSLVRLGEIDPRTEFGATYATASTSQGAVSRVFTEAVQPFISSSRISEHNEIKYKNYASSQDAYTDTPLSSSFEPAEYQSMAYDSKLFRLFYKGQLLTKKNTIDGKEPVEITITSPTKLVTQEPGDSKLKVE